MTPHPDVLAYNDRQTPELAVIWAALAASIRARLPEAEGKVWHGGPVWFLAGNPIVDYWVRKVGVQLLFWSGQSFDEPGLKPEGKFKAAEQRVGSLGDVDSEALSRRLGKARDIRWDYKNIEQNRGLLARVPKP